jgi:hypothetical protein
MDLILKYYLDELHLQRVNPKICSCNLQSLILSVNTEKYEEALVALKEALKDVCLENMNRSAFLRLQNGLLKQGKTFPYEIPVKVRYFTA